MQAIDLERCLRSGYVDSEKLFQSIDVYKAGQITAFHVLRAIKCWAEALRRP